MSDQNIINELKAIELYAYSVAASAKSLGKLATGLRARMEGNGSSSAPQGLSDDQKGKLISKRFDNLNRRIQKQA